MDVVDSIIAMFMTTMRKNNQRIAEIAGEETPSLEDFQEGTKLMQHNQMCSLLCQTLHETQARNIKGIFSGS